ncbi:MAG: hypothetical protein CSA11_06755 [Chloroflexi bacterium]|nr:MAG: hypothetical protein CSA11_06755 [Chloroflexota bacterium]
MTMSGPRLRSLIRQAERAKEAGKLAAAEQSYREILAAVPDSAEAWLGLARLLKDEKAKEEAYLQVLAIDEADQAAQIELARLRGEPVPEFEEEVGMPNPEDAAVSSPDWMTAMTIPQSFRMPPPEGETAVSKPTVPPDPPPVKAVKEYELYCYRHPDRVTALRCYSCNRPICSSCTNKTPVGYICPECKHEAEDKFFSASTLDYIIVGVLSFILSLIAGGIVVRLGGSFMMILIILFVGGAVGGFIAKLSMRVIGGRRGRYLPHLVALMVVLGVVIPALPYLLLALVGGFSALFGLLVPGIYAFIASSAAYYWMR